MKLGRNDPCHCGSGKKYKKCHMAQDAAHGPVLRPPAVPKRSVPAPVGPEQTLGRLQELARRGPPAERAAFRELAAEAQPLLEYYARREEIEAASTALESHRAEFLRFIADEPRYLDRVEKLFAEDRFAPLRLSAADVRRAFDKVGYPPAGLPDDEVVHKLRAAILFLADVPYRSRCSMALLQHLPEEVAAGRYLDAWVLQDCALQVMERTGESTVFLFQMFSHGYDAWLREQQAAGDAILREVGIDPARARTMTLEDMDAWVAAQAADPKKTARLQAIMKAHPEQEALSTVNLQQREHNSVELLQRPDAGHLLLSAAELEPWLPIFMERVAKFQAENPTALADAQPSEAIQNALVDAIHPALGEMAAGIFTPDRIRRLIAQLRAYRNTLYAAGDTAAVSQAMGAITYLEREDEPALNRFLVLLCFTSIQQLGSGTEDSVPEAEDATADTEDER